VDEVLEGWWFYVGKSDDVKKEIEILLRRAEGFVKDSLEDLNRGD
jgi:hypothetical protein